MAFAEEKPAFPACPAHFPLLQEGPVRRDPSARANHDDWSIIGWQSEMRVALDVNRQDRVRLGAIGQHTRSDASTGLAMKRIAHGRYGKVRFVWRSRQAGSDGDRKSTRLNSSHYCASRMPS